MNEAILYTSLIWVIIVLVFIEIKDKKHNQELIDIGEDFEKEKEKVRKEAIESSKRVTRGQVAEQMLPIFPDFPYNPSDCKFFSAPIDYLVFEGMSDVRSSSEGEISIVFADVKTGAAKKTLIQKKIKDAVDNGRVRFEEWRVDKDNKITVK